MLSAWWSLGGAGGDLGGLSISSGVCCLGQSGRGVAVMLHLQHVCIFFALPMWQRRQPFVSVARIIAGCHSIAAFTILRRGIWTPRYLSSRTSTWHSLIMCCICCSAAPKNPPLVILPRFIARHMSDCSSCTWSPCPAIVGDMLETNRTLVASENEIPLLPTPYTLP